MRLQTASFVRRFAQAGTSDDGTLAIELNVKGAVNIAVAG